MQDAGLLSARSPGTDVDAYNRLAAMSVSKYLRVNYKTNGISQLGGSHIYFRRGKWSEENIMHEGLHNAGYSDPFLKNAFGIPETSPSGEINNKLKEHGCIQ